jgi:hypothetical protein
MDHVEDGLPIPQRYWAILTLMVRVALSCLDTALVNVALPRIAKDLNSSPATRLKTSALARLPARTALYISKLGQYFCVGK